MQSSEPIEELMLRWEDARQQGRFLSPEELCGAAPHLAEELRRRIRGVLAMERVMGVAAHDPERTHVAGTAHEPAGQLPTIPGYHVMRVLGQGGMGVVYEARHIELGRSAAIKMIAGGPLRPAALARFGVEAKAAARLMHPNFVQIFEVGQVSGRPFLAMEYVAGCSLADYLQRGAVAPADAAALIETLARAMHAAHEQSIIHRDLKPANILLPGAPGSRDPNVSATQPANPVGAPPAVDLTAPKITDFGLAKRLDEEFLHSVTGEILGTPSYMAPEQAIGDRDQIGPRTDVYALGAILYELLAGQPPLQGVSPLDALRLIVTQDPVPPTRLAPAVPRELEAICLKCLEKSPIARYDSALALADDLRRFLNGQPVKARRLGPIARWWKWVRRHPLQTALAGTLAALALIPAAALVESYRTQREVRLKALEQAPLVREILERNCFACHGQNSRRAKKDLNILDHRQLLDSARRIVVAGAPENSRLLQRIADGSMPPEEEEKRLPRLSEMELTTLTDWIRGGAPPLPPAGAEPPGPPAAPAELAAQAKAIFIKHCYECHKYDVAKGGIKILHHRLLVTVRKVVNPGNPDDSELYQLLASEDDELRMPPAPRARISDQELATIRRWIEEGAAPFP